MTNCKEYVIIVLEREGNMTGKEMIIRALDLGDRYLVKRYKGTRDWTLTLLKENGNYITFDNYHLQEVDDFGGTLALLDAILSKQVKGKLEYIGRTK